MTTLASWCIFLIFVTLCVGYGVWRENEYPLPVVPEPDEMPVLIDDHDFDGGWHLRDTCQFIYEGESDFMDDEVCGMVAEGHARIRVSDTVSGNGHSFWGDDPSGYCGCSDCNPKGEYDG